MKTNNYKNTNPWLLLMPIKTMLLAFITLAFTAANAQNDFITKWNMNTAGSGANQISFYANTTGTAGYSWVAAPSGTSGSGTFTTGTLTISGLPATDTITLSIAPTNFNYMQMYSSTDKNRLVDVRQWGTTAWTSMYAMFENCSNLDVTATDVPNISNLTSLYRLFFLCPKLKYNSSIGSWNTTNITNMEYMFYNCALFNQDISSWNTSKVRSIVFMFSGCTAFNQPIGNWNTDSLRNMYYMLGNARSFNQDISNWNTGRVTDMSFAFAGASAFNQDISGWNTANVIDMNRMFSNATAFKQPIGSWNVAKVTNMSAMFSSTTFNEDISSWTTTALTTCDYMFINNTAFNQNIGGWNTANVTNMYGMFYGATAFNQNIGNWNTANVTDMRYMFYSARAFNQNIGSWNTGNVTNMSSMFYDATAFNQNIGSWNTANVTNMSYMFQWAIAFNYNIGNWSTANVTDMNRMFYSATAFNQNIGSWNTAAVSNMAYMFYSARAFNQNIGNWSTANVTNMDRMFYDARAFNQPIGSWNTAAVTNMYGMFQGAIAFNYNIGTWNTAAVTNMAYMFLGATAFNQPIGNWNTANVTDMRGVFNGATAFNQNISNWSIANVTNMDAMFQGTTAFNRSLAAWVPNLNTSVVLSSFLNNSGLNALNYDSTLVALNASSINNKTMGAAGLRYCTASAARTNLTTTKGWTIPDAGLHYTCDTGVFITKWNLATAGSSTTGLIFGVDRTGTVAYNWTASPSGNTGSGTFNGSTLSITSLPTNNVITLYIAPTNFTRINIGGGSDRNRLIDVSQWGTTAWTSMENAFNSCSNLNITATDKPNLSGVTNMNFMFISCISLNSPSNIGTWNTANVTSMSSMFYNATAFNQNIGSWNTANVSNMSIMFYRATAFNQNIGNWNTANVSNMSGMFQSATAFNQNIGNWNTANVSNMNAMFDDATVFNQNIGSWNTANVANMSYMLRNARAFNQNISSWNTANITNMSNMFNGATAFNRSLAAWAPNLNAGVNLGNFLNNSGLNTLNYDSTLIAFNTYGPNGRIMNATGLRYCTASAARANLLTTKGWTLTDAGQHYTCDTSMFVTKWNLATAGSSTTGLSFGAATNGGIVSFNWTASPSGTSGSGTFNSTTLTINSLPANNTITLYINPTNFTRININNGVDSNRLIDVSQWGTTAWASMQNAFYGCANLNITATDKPNLTGVSSMSGMFYNCISLNSPSNIGTWNTTNVTNMNIMFGYATVFNQNIGSWNTANVTTMNFMFGHATAFNQNIGSWNTANVTNMSNMFSNATAFNQNIGSWNTANVTTMIFMFGYATAFNQNIGSWNTANVTTMSGMFYGATAFNRSLAAWAPNLNAGVNLGSFLNNSGLNTLNYDSTLIAFNTYGPNGRSMGATGLKYCVASSARTNLTTTKSWTITGDATFTPAPAVVASGIVTEPMSYCAYNLNPNNTSNKLIGINANGNTFNPAKMVIDNTGTITTPNVTNTNGYYQITDGTNTMRVSNRMLTIVAPGSYTTNGGVIVRMYYNAADTMAIITDATPAGSITEYGWFKSPLHGADSVVRNITAADPHLEDAQEIRPRAWGTESGVRYVEFLLTSFSTIGFYANSSLIPLPIKLISFNVKNTNCSNTLTFTTAEEQNATHINVEYSANGSSFETIATIKAKGGMQVNNYQYTHTANSPVSFYRLKMVENEAKAKYSAVQVVNASNCNTTENVVSIYPNPVVQTLNITSNYEVPVTVSIYQLDGKLISQTTINSPTNAIDMSNMAAGVYMVTLSNGNTILKTEKIVKQ